MARLPQTGSDQGTWGEILNTYLGVEHNPDGTLKASGALASKADVSSLSPVATSGSYTDLTDKPTISSVPVTSVNTKTGAVVLSKNDVGLSSVDDTSDANKPVSSAQQTALNLKAPLASPAFTGTPTVPTASGGTNTTQVASTAFVTAAVVAAVPVLASTSTTLRSYLPTGSKTFTLVTPTNLTVGMFVEARSTNSLFSYMSGLVTAVSSTSITIDAQYINDSYGDNSDNAWSIHIGGTPGNIGATGPTGTSQTFAEHLDFGFSGVQTVRSGVFFQTTPNVATHIKEIIMIAGTPPTGANLIIDVKNNGSTIFTSSTQRPFIAPGSPFAYGNGTGLNIALAARSRLSIDVTQIGSGTAGSDVSVQIVYTRD